MPSGGSSSSDSTGAVGIPGAGTVYFHDFTLSAQWGRLNAKDGVFRAADGATVSVAARRDHPAGGRLERHTELRVGSAAGGTAWLLYHGSREVISVTHTGRRRGAPARPLATELAVV